MILKKLKKLRLQFTNRLALSYIHRRKNNIFRDILISENKNKWLDIGCSNTFSDDFYYSDILDETEIPIAHRSKYRKLDITKPITDNHLNEFGTFDLIRMQHVFEHFSPEDGQTVLTNCSKLLKNGGYLLISVPDLGIFVDRYSAGGLKDDETFCNWARTRIEKDAPQSFYFSIFTHSVPYQAHLWCYDEEGLKYQINKNGNFEKIKKIKITDQLFNYPFTHNRPLEDLCVMCQKK